MKINIKNYLLYSSVFAIFSEGFFINYIIDWRLLYLIVFVNFFIFYRYYKIVTHKKFLFIISAILLHAIINYSIIGIPPNFFISQIIGISIIGLYFYNFFKIIHIDEIKNFYLKLCVYIAILGYIFYFIKFNPFAYFQSENRLMSIFKEPAHYVVVIIPACFYFFKNKDYFKFILLFISIILSESSLGYIGCGLMFVLPLLRLKMILYLFSTLPFVVLIFWLTYQNNSNFKLRIDGTFENIKVIEHGKFKNDTNLSSYVFLANLRTALINFSEYPLGTGIGSHHYMYTKIHYYKTRPPEYIKILDHRFDNSFNANSMFNRMFSEFGIFGFLIVLIFIVKNRYIFNHVDYLTQGIFIYFLLKLFRDGTYFPPELFFFIWYFYFTSKPNVNELNALNE